MCNVHMQDGCSMFFNILFGRIYLVWIFYRSLCLWWTQCDACRPGRKKYSNAKLNRDWHNGRGQRLNLWQPAGLKPGCIAPITLQAKITLMWTYLIMLEYKYKVTSIILNSFKIKFNMLLYMYYKQIQFQFYLYLHKY